MARVVVDTNVLVSALVGGGKPRELLIKLQKEHTVIFSRQMAIELAEVLARDKFKVKPSQIEKYLSILIRKSKMVAIHSQFKVISEDPDDDTVLNTAYSGKADYIITGDKHLLTLKEFKKTKIINTTQMLQIAK